MTTQLPKERLKQAIEQLENFATNLKWKNVNGAQTLLFAADGLRALLEAYEQEPYGYVHKAVYEMAGSCGLSSDHEAYRNTNGTHIPLYTHPAPSIPAAVPEEATPAIIDMMARKFEWGAAECIAAFRSWNACRAAMLKPEDVGQLTARSDQRLMDMPASLPEAVMSAILKVVRIRCDFNEFDGDRRGIADCLDEAEQELILAINANAAMLQAEPQNAQQNIPVNIPEGYALVPVEPTAQRKCAKHFITRMMRLSDS